MKTLGIITEYNPFHKGHAYMIEKAKRKANADRVVVVMSGSFVQRGEPAIFDKWTRTEAALKNGVDMVLELPVLFAASKAETFARAAVRILSESGIVDVLCFGSESGDLHSLQEAAKLMANETEEFQRLLKEQLDEGLSYPSARAKVLETVSHISSEILSRPNHILGLEYLKALDYYSCSIEPMTIKREGDYNSTSLTDGYASAAAIRKALAENRSTEAMTQLPENTHDLYNKALSLGTAPVFWEELAPALHYKLRTTSAEELREIAEVTEGLENRILRSIETCYEINDIMDFIKTKRYTRTKIQRILLHILLDIKEKEVSYFLNLPKMPYIRVLGFQKEHSDLLAELTENAKCPVLTNLKKAPALLNEDGLALLALEKTATDLHAMAYPNPIYRSPNQDFTKPLVIL
ncbi:nucleotidyltransferase [Anaerotignum sp.]